MDKFISSVCAIAAIILTIIVFSHSIGNSKEGSSIKQAGNFAKQVMTEEEVQMELLNELSVSGNNYDMDY